MIAEFEGQGKLLDYTSPELAAYPPEAHDRGQWATARIVGVIMAYNKNVLPANLTRVLREVRAVEGETRLSRRYEKFRNMGRLVVDFVDEGN